MLTKPVPPNHLIKLVGSDGGDEYAKIGEHCLDLLVKYGGLKPEHHVLDVGCGCGRTAIPLTNYLTSGSYEGFDIVRESITWCAQNITPHWPGFKFQHANVFNKFYNPGAAIKAKDYRFPYSDNSFNLTFLTSVFTHMLPDDVAHYTREITRTLKPGGAAVITFFIINDESRYRQLTAESTLRFPHIYANDTFITNSARPELAVAYREDSALRVLKDNGLQLREPIHFGNWCGRKNGVTYQDLIVCDKP